MAFDAAFLRAVAKELSGAVGLKIDKVYQPTKDEIILSLRGFKEQKRLLLSANANNPRVSFTESTRENPLTAPNFCMFLRKHIAGYKINKVLQMGFERALIFELSGFNDFNEPVTKYLIIEIMGRYSNILLTGSDKMILDAIRHIDFTVSEKRQILPGLFYEQPPAQQKQNPLTATKEEIAEIFHKAGDRRADKVLLDGFLGLSPLICREICYRGTGAVDTLISALSEQQKEKLIFQTEHMFELIRNGNNVPVMLLSPETNKPYDFSFTHILQYGTALREIEKESFGELLDGFYEERDRVERIMARSKDILRLIVNNIERVTKKQNLHAQKLKEAEKKDELKILGDLINANLYKMQKGDKELVCENFYDPDYKEIKISLDEMLSPSENAQRYYKKYQKAKSTELNLNVQMKKSKEEQEYLESVFENLALSETENDLNEIKEELSEQGYYTEKKVKKGKKKTSFVGAMEFCSSEGFRMLAGKNNSQNDELSLRIAGKDDLWCHAKNMPGCHLIIFADGREISKKAITEGCTIAAFYSKGKESSNIAVDYTFAKFVKKPSGAKPGRVIYKNFETAYVTPEEELCNKLRVK